MCMTSTKPIGGYAAQSALPYTEESPLPVCQWKELGSSSSSSSWATTTSTTSSNETTPIVVSAWSSPTTATTSATSTTIDTSTRLMQGMKRRRKLQELPLPLRKRTCRTPKERFAAFVTILLLHLDGGGKNQLKRNFKLSVQAKALVAECCRRNQMGDAHFSPLQESLSERLHGLVGEAHWTRAREYLYIYLTRHFGFRPGQDEQEEDRQLLHIPSNTIAAVTATIRRNSTGPSK